MGRKRNERLCCEGNDSASFFTTGRIDFLKWLCGNDGCCYSVRKEEAGMIRTAESGGSEGYPSRIRRTRGVWYLEITTFAVMTVGKLKLM